MRRCYPSVLVPSFLSRLIIGQKKHGIHRTNNYVSLPRTRRKFWVLASSAKDPVLDHHHHHHPPLPFLLDHRKGHVRCHSKDVPMTLPQLPKNKRRGCPPRYDERAAASMVFNNAYFYDDDEEWAQSEKLCQRRAEHLGTMTVKDVYEKYVLEKGSVKLGLTVFACLFFAVADRIMEYYAPATIQVESILKHERLIDLSDGQEWIVFNERCVNTVPVMDQIWASTWNEVDSTKERQRTLPLGLVLGPSGSGKTCFTLKYLSQRFEKPKEVNDSVTIYLKVGDTPIQFNDAKAALDILDWIKDAVAKRIKRQELPKLDMHVVIILDEAGAKGVQSWFENKEMLSALCAQTASLATSVAVVVSGTGLTGSAFCSSKDAFIFRMKHWQSRDMATILHKETNNLHLAEQETIETVVNAIFDHPKLGALGTNARSAYFLTRALSRQTSLYARQSWPYQLDQWAPTIVTQVVDSYIVSNSLCKLHRHQRRRVAACIFRALNELQPHETKPTQQFLGVEGSREISAVESLLQCNLDRNENELRIVPGEQFAFTLTPALAIVIYALAGLPTTLMPAWKQAEKEVAALYAARQWILGCMESYAFHNHHPQTKQGAVAALQRLEQTLDTLNVISLQKPIQIKQGRIHIPMCRVGTIIVNGDNASFADVIAPNCFIQVKSVTTKSFLDLDLCVELQKCSLLKKLVDDTTAAAAAAADNDNVGDQYHDTRLLLGLVAMWRGDLDPLKFKATRKRLGPGKDPERPASKAFPENLLCGDDGKNENVRYAWIKDKATQITMDNNRTKLDLPSLDGINNLSFIVCTNASTIHMQLSSETIIPITQANLNRDMSINRESLSPNHQSIWDNFVVNKVLEGVTIRFLFTKSGWSES